MVGSRLNQVPRWVIAVTTAALISVFAGSAAASSAQPAAAGLLGVFCTSAASCWAVGNFERNGAWLNEALRWDGHRWSRVAAPSPAPTPAGTLSGDFNELNDVACTSPASCWAAGQYGNNSVNGEVIENQALHWNGRAWSLVTTPNPGGNASEDVSMLNAIRCASAGNCWAVGSYGSIAPGGVLFNEALHWNGKKWSLAAAPDPQTAGNAFNVLKGLACTSAANCWATGSDGYDGSSALTVNQVLHWNGHKWSEVSVPEPDGTGDFASNTLESVSCSSADSCWAVGSVGNLDLVAPVKNEALHWNGTHWSMASVPQPGGNAEDDHSFLYGVRCTSRTNCWAVGQALSAGKFGRNELMHWNGTKWSAA